MANRQLDKPTERSERGGRHSARREFAVICGILSVGVFAWLVYGMVDVAEIYGDVFGGGWTVLWILMAAAGSLLAAGSVVLWNPPGSRSVVTKAVVGIAVVLILVFGGFFLFGPQV